MFIATTLAAQTLPASGARVGVWADDGLIAAGAFVRVSGDTIVLADPDGSALAVTLPPGRAWGTSMGTSGQTLQGMAAGLLVGGAVGAMVGFATYEQPDCRNQFICLDFGPNFNAAAGLAVGAVSGLVGGGILGWVVRHERWHRLGRLEPQVSIAPTRSQRATLAVSLRF